METKSALLDEFKPTRWLQCVLIVSRKYSWSVPYCAVVAIVCDVLLRQSWGAAATTPPPPPPTSLPYTCDGCPQAVEGAGGTIDLLVNNAGVAMIEDFMDASVESFDKLIAVNTRAPLLVSQVRKRRLRKLRAGRGEEEITSIDLEVRVKRFMKTCIRVQKRFHVLSENSSLNTFCSSQSHKVFGVIVK